MTSANILLLCTTPIAVTYILTVMIVVSKELSMLSIPHSICDLYITKLEDELYLSPSICKQLQCHVVCKKSNFDTIQSINKATVSKFLCFEVLVLGQISHEFWQFQ